jgi:fatty acid desaturase
LAVGVDQRDFEAVKRRLRASLPARAFDPSPVRALWFVPLLAVETLATAGLATNWGGLGAAIVLSLIAGSTYASLLLLAHEVMHGAITRSRRWQYGLAWLGFTPFLISPTLWQVWHNEVHHAYANDPARDPDTFADESMAAGSRASRAVLRLVPGAGGLASFFFPFFWFVAQGQIVLWYSSRVLPGFARLRRRAAASEVAAMAAFWAAVSFAIGWGPAMLAIALPLGIGNAVLMAYIATNHLLRPLAGSGDPVDVAMSVKTPALLDRLHFRFSHHVEHHLFPAMSGRHLPLVRAGLERICPDRFVCAPHVRALRWLYATPRTYRDRTTLVDPLRPCRPATDLVRLARELRVRPIADVARVRYQGNSGISAPGAN